MLSSSSMNKIRATGRQLLSPGSRPSRRAGRARYRPPRWCQIAPPRWSCSGRVPGAAAARPRRQRKGRRGLLQAGAGVPRRGARRPGPEGTDQGQSARPRTTRDPQPAGPRLLAKAGVPARRGRVPARRWRWTPSSPRPGTTWARCYIDQGRFDAAIPVLETPSKNCLLPDAGAGADQPGVGPVQDRPARRGGEAPTGRRSRWRGDFPLAHKNLGDPAAGPPATTARPWSSSTGRSAPTRRRGDSPQTGSEPAAPGGAFRGAGGLRRAWQLAPGSDTGQDGQDLPRVPGPG